MAALYTESEEFDALTQIAAEISSGLPPGPGAPPGGAAGADLDRTLEVQGFEDQQARSWARAVEGVLPVMSCVCDPTRRPCSIAQCLGQQALMVR
jgi:hypothetical protein